MKPFESLVPGRLIFQNPRHVVAAAVQVEVAYGKKADSRSLHPAWNIPLFLFHFMVFCGILSGFGTFEEAEYVFPLVLQGSDWLFGGKMHKVLYGWIYENILKILSKFAAALWPFQMTGSYASIFCAHQGSRRLLSSQNDQMIGVISIGFTVRWFKGEEESMSWSFRFFSSSALLFTSVDTNHFFRLYVDLYHFDSRAWPILGRSTSEAGFRPNKLMTVASSLSCTYFIIFSHVFTYFHLVHEKLFLFISIFQSHRFASLKWNSLSCQPAALE